MNHCPICDSETESIIARELRRGSGQVFHCESCHHGFLVSEYQVDLEKYYREDYRREVAHKSASSSTNARELFDTYRSYQKSRLDIIRPFLDSKTSLLEVGASAGQFLVHIKDDVKKVCGIELDLDCHQFLKNELSIDADSHYLDESKFSAEKFDIVCAFQVMEHVHSPLDFIASLDRVTIPDGSIFIEVPNIDDPLLSVWNVPYYHTFYYHSAHIHYFSESSLRKLANQAGFTDAQISFHFTQDYNLLNHLNWILNNSPQSDCHIGLSEINLKGNNDELAAWLNSRLRELNQDYINKLSQFKSTSNIMMHIKK